MEEYIYECFFYNFTILHDHHFIYKFPNLVQFMGNDQKNQIMLFLYLKQQFENSFSVEIVQGGSRFIGN
ncbi:hypothetical protein M5X11_04870 [Paenibacillus alginolyticus]|uniref:Uncharacterized protein n=1 Tax=Paenibacillus alginolyticus TaxID=59839 RepID=A0ABT4GCG4_9BACL|nr:hypothetical protein [Paenibacillus alginolyticus]MCY9664310.1 hypothetical protein [Paenibacillus alginolyticus]MCY9693844.1 hypothetical protein [Paenibacillus alginolyticus]MEC0148179.1 hypothetical protein [Paenibacillus alginolyticus]